jgi:hypothetical protein
MRIVGFVGASGTRKSYRALWVAKERDIDYLIDDGLLIHQERIVAGKSAKRAPTKIGSVKAALFMDATHRNEVIDAINRRSPKAILVLGTSDAMVERIAQTLNLGAIEHIIYIDEVASEYEIKQAINTRLGQGKHVIPVPNIELKKDFSGYFLDPLQIFRRKSKGNFQEIGEKSVVRPPFSYKGKYTISDYAIYQIVNRIIVGMDEMEKIARFRLNMCDDGVILDMDVIMVYGYNLVDAINQAIKAIIDDLGSFAGMNTHKIYINAKGLVMKKSHEQVPWEDLS